MATAKCKSAKCVSARVTEDIIGLAILECRLRETQSAVKSLRQRIEARVPGGSRLARDRQFVEVAIRAHNQRVASEVRS